MAPERHNHNRSRSPRSDRQSDRRRERSPEYDGPRNRDRAQQHQQQQQREFTQHQPRTSRLDYDDKTRQRGRGRRGSNSSVTHDTPSARGDAYTSTAKQSVSSSSRAVLTVDPTPFGENTNWDVEPTELRRVLGIAGFNSTKETKVPGNNLNYGVDRVKTTTYRQYMNRVGGFNRPLSPPRTNQFAKVADTSGIDT
ncbi:hypothetical protein AMS68_007558 [Peltaster fructicola]|uniref:U4/U6.U5 small nuclear ribonucleoprotein 27kDa protein domain-containing protein n=1 Tax=Peltaster fructicola TaxID=286661 RepID=A0A6H0Y546_9PEZI|nr:hypothetical protein AMS68_007558 [Peltaster fructicola]